MRKSKKHQLSFPCRHHLSRTYDTTRTRPPRHTHASAPTPLRTCIPLSRTYDTTRTQPLRHSHAPTTPLSRIRGTTLAHLRHHSHTTAPPLSRTFVLHLYTLAPPIAHLRPPFPLSELIRINQNLSELIRYPPRNFDGS